MADAPVRACGSDRRSHVERRRGRLAALRLRSTRPRPLAHGGAPRQRMRCVSPRLGCGDGGAAAIS
eukprot:4057458-Prymnesium_polylepis.1